MSTIDRRAAAAANQRAAAFIRFQMLDDRTAMGFILAETADGSLERLAFIVALASMAATTTVRNHGREKALEYFQMVANTSAKLLASDDIDRFFDDGAG
jgi:hypothetical protein